MGGCYLGDEAALYVRIELFQQSACVFCAGATEVCFLEKEVDAQVCLVHHGRILDGEVAGAGQDQVLQCLETNDAGTRADEEDVRVLEGHLARGAPQA